MNDSKLFTEFKFEISIESPIHIGSGDELYSNDFVVQNESVFFIDIDKVLQEVSNKGMDPQVLCNEIEQFGMQFDLKKFLDRYMINPSKVSRYSLPCHWAPRRIRTLVKNAFGIPLIPGSSIKGAMRTALAWYFLKDEGMRNEVETTLQKVLWDLDQIRDRKRRENASRNWERKIGQELEDLVFYGKKRDPQYDIHKAVTVTDTSLKADLLELAVCKIFSLNREKRLVPEKYDIFTEVIMPGSRAGTTEISLNRYFLERKLSEIGFNKDKVSLLKEFPRICNEFSNNLIEYELDFFKTFELPELVQFYEKLLNSSSEKNNGFLLRLGYGVGWISTTVGLILKENPNLLGDIRRQFRLGKRRNQPNYVPEFPKTRKIIMDERTPRYPMGWVRLKEIT